MSTYKRNHSLFVHLLFMWPQFISIGTPFVWVVMPFAHFARHYWLQSLCCQLRTLHCVYTWGCVAQAMFSSILLPSDANIGDKKCISCHTDSTTTICCHLSVIKTKSGSRENIILLQLTSVCVFWHLICQENSWDWLLASSKKTESVLL